MTIGGRKIQTRSLAVSPTNTNGLTPALVTSSHWLVDTFLFSDWQKPQIYFPIWLMFVSGRQPVWTLWQSRFLTWWNSTTLCSFPFNSIFLLFLLEPKFCVCRFVCSTERHDCLFVSNLSVSFKYSKEGKKLSPRVKFLWTWHEALSRPRPLWMQASDWSLLSPSWPLIGHNCPPWAPDVHCRLVSRWEMSWVQTPAKYAD